MSTDATAESVALTYFNDSEARSVEAIAERLIPDDGSGTGATIAGVVYYIDRAISGFSTKLQPIYRRGLRDLQAYCGERYGKGFEELNTSTQDGIIASVLGPATSEADSTDAGLPTYPLPPAAARMLTVVREHTIEGFFCDPVYGGNRDAVGWKLVGFPGAYWGYTAKQMGPGVDGRALPIKTLSDLRKELQTRPDNATYTRNEEN